MNKEEFENGMDRIRNVFGEKSYPQERVSIIWNEMHRLTANEFNSIIRELIASCSQPPLIGKFREAKAYVFSSSEAIRSEEKKLWIEAQPECTLCGKTGWIQAEHKENGNTYAFRCICPCGERLISHSVPQWRQSFKDKYNPRYVLSSYDPPAEGSAKPIIAAAIKNISGIDNS